MAPLKSSAEGSKLASLLEALLEERHAIAPARMTAAEGLQLSADIAGDPWRHRLIFLHGGGQSRFSWRKALRIFTDDGYSVISYDLRGHGESGWSPSGDYSLEAHMRDLVCVVRSCPPRPIIIGASLGGRVALAAAAELGPDAIAGLILVDLTPKLDPRGLSRVLGFLGASKLGFESISAAIDTLDLYAESQYAKVSEDFDHTLSLAEDGRYYWKWDPAAALDASLDPLEIEAKLRIAARRAKVPTLLIRGTESDLVTAECVADFLEAMPWAEVIEIAGQGHLMKGANRELFCAAALDFIRRTVGRTSPEIAVRPPHYR